ncbi:RsmB/NOP family class I SAM-dependent RNA methyltransferase [Lentilactobacillus sp. Marseille-Q4993]|uniref:RsmB/NOP family class I SAM-dependent RNA methyltransferase n=1 Tax=Lentilactobacillus sp. Marseille-Q4993 TaxID=3039492 RepID=UPI0024BCE2F3|nr:RsmB/NOP family class I SAM-dependent RNA methyltransferase [Lentilactobacillus sp. Marseille-Q4993]
MELPADFITKYKQLLGEADATAFFESFNQPVNHGFRVNPLKNVPADKLADFKKAKHCEFGYYGKVNGKSVLHQSGAVYSQEPSAMYVGEVAKPNKGEKVLDLCAAPGGKTTHLGSYLANTGLLVANEIDGKRSKVLAENVERFSLRNTVIINENPARVAKAFPAFFDRMLVDAPCSGEGMFRKDPDAVQYWSKDYPIECATRQREILTEAVKALKPGGELIYSTCTFAPEEDEQIVAWLVKEYDFEILPVEKFPGMDDGRPEWADSNPDLTKCVRLFPFHFAGEGHFIAKLRKPMTDEAEPKYKGLFKNRNIHKMTGDEKKLWDKFKRENNISYDGQTLFTYNDKLMSVPDEMIDASKIKVVRMGIELGTFKKNRFEPSYALGLALTNEENQNQVAINEDEWHQYVHGDTFPIATGLKGWQQLIVSGLPVGFVKAVQGTAKNFFPKGLRF